MSDDRFVHDDDGYQVFPGLPDDAEEFERAETIGDGSGGMY